MQQCNENGITENEFVQYFITMKFSKKNMTNDHRSSSLLSITIKFITLRLNFLFVIFLLYLYGVRMRVQCAVYNGRENRNDVPSNPKSIQSQLTWWYTHKHSLSLWLKYETENITIIFYLCLISIFKSSLNENHKKKPKWITKWKRTSERVRGWKNRNLIDYSLDREHWHTYTHIHHK